MIAKQKVLTAFRESGLVAIIRTEKPSDLVAVARALVEGGVKLVEITLTVPRALEIIRDATAQLRDVEVFIGAGTVLDAPTARSAILAGAAFIVGPGFAPEITEVCRTYGITYVPGALTPQEIVTAWKGGADVVKVFPAVSLGGPDYLKAVREPLPQIELMPTGGIDVKTAAAYLKVGAVAVGVGGGLVNKALIAAQDYARITENARTFIQTVREAKGTK